MLAHDRAQHSRIISACGFRNDKTVTIGSQKITAEVADTTQARTKGLSGRPCIGQNEGMLFVFNQPGFYQFWMKDMKFPIDIIWITTNHRVIGLKSKAQPLSYPQKFVNQTYTAQYVLELASGRALSLGVGPTTTVNF